MIPEDKTLRRIGKFILSGGTAALVEYLTFIVLYNVLDTWLILSNIISFSLGLITSYSLNKLWVFDTKGDTKRSFALYLLLAGVNLCISSGLLWVSTYLLSVDPLIAKIIIMVLVATWNYFIFSKFIFANKQK